MSKLKRLRANIEVLRKALDKDPNCYDLEKYTGFGGLDFILNSLDKSTWNKSDLPYYDDTLKLYALLYEHAKDESEYNRWVQSLKSSVLTAFYTPDAVVIKIMESIFNGSMPKIRCKRMLDPAAGSGVFFRWATHFGGRGPRMFEYEKDLLQGLILKWEYKARCVWVDVRVKGFETIPDSELGTYDVVATNVPFGDIRVFDSAYTHSDNAARREAARFIHRYYVLKGLDCLRNGGIEAFIITNNYLNNDGEQLLEVFKHARLVGAYRLANNLFKENGTEVGTDLLVLQKDNDKKTLSPDEALLLTQYSEGGCRTNMYFAMHRDHIIATETKIGTDAYGKPAFVYTHSGGVNSIASDLGLVLKRDLSLRFNSRLYNAYFSEQQKSESEQSQSSAIAQPHNTEAHDDGKSEQDWMEEPVKKLLRIHEIHQKLFVYEATKLEEDVKDRKELNRLYDEYRKEYGSLNDCNKTILNKLKEKGILSELLALEVQVGKDWHKADIFSKPVAFDMDEIREACTPQEALAQCLNDKGYPDMPCMMALTGLSESELLAKLDGDVYYNPLTEKYEIAAKYVSGNVVEKIKAIRDVYDIKEDANTDKADEDKLSEQTVDPRVIRSLRALEEAVPTPIPFEELDFNLGERWISTDLYEQFGSAFFSMPESTNRFDQVKMQVKYDPILDQFAASADNSWNEKICTQYHVDSECSRYNGIDLFIYALKDVFPKMWRYKRDANGCKISDGKSGFLKEEDSQKTQLAQSKVCEIRNAWVDWLTQQPKDVKDELARQYNEKFNCFVKPRYDGSHQRFPGLDRKKLEAKYGVKDLYQSQKDCIWMLVQNQGGICDHEVGTGKTLIMCIAAHEMKRLGLVHKPMIIGLKANVGAIAETYQDAYPKAKVLYAQNKDFREDERVVFFNRMKNNDYDCVIMSHDQFARLPQSDDVQVAIMQDELDQLEDAMTAVRGYSWQNSHRLMKGLERRKRNLEAKLRDALYSINHRKDDVADFKMMGIDHIFVDESHAFKNLGFATCQNRVAGLGNTEGSKRAFNLLMSIRTIQERTGKDLGATFLSGTTVTNSLTELYSLFRYLRPKALAKQSITSFDAWAAIFTKKSTEFEFSITNTIVMKERFRYFIKVPELAQFYNEITDYRTAEDVGLERPKKRVRLLNIEPTPDQQEYTQTLMKFAQTGDFSLIGKEVVTVEQQKAKMLYATDLARKMALDMRMIDESYPDHPRSKSSMCAKLVKQYYDKYDKGKGTQLIFSDLSTYQGKGKGWNVYEDIKQKLVDMGVPSNEIRFIQECKCERTKDKMIQDVNDGKVRVLFGSTSMLGTGVNAQKRVVCIHHLDTPWRPSDLEQRNGRGVRKGNEIAKLYADNTVDIIIYAVKRSLDAYKFGLLNNKQTFISQLKRGQLGVRTLDEGSMDEKSGMNFAEYMAVLSGNTDLLERAKLGKQIAGMEAERKAFYRDKTSQQQKMERLKADNEKLEKNIERAKRDNEQFSKQVRRDDKGEALNMITIDGFTPYAKDKSGKLTRTVLDPNAAPDAFDVAMGEMLQKIGKSTKTNGELRKIGSVYGFPISVKTKAWANEYQLGVQYENLFYVCVDNLVYPINGESKHGQGRLNYTSKRVAARLPLDAMLRIPNIISGWEQLQEENVARIKQLDAIVSTTWGRETELAKLRSDLAALDMKINKTLQEDKAKESVVA